MVRLGTESVSVKLGIARVGMDTAGRLKVDRPVGRVRVCTSFLTSLTVIVVLGSDSVTVKLGIDGGAVKIGIDNVGMDNVVGIDKVVGIVKV